MSGEYESLLEGFPCPGKLKEMDEDAPFFVSCKSPEEFRQRYPKFRGEFWMTYSDIKQLFIIARWDQLKNHFSLPSFRRYVITDSGLFRCTSRLFTVLEDEIFRVKIQQRQIDTKLVDDDYFDDGGIPDEPKMKMKINSC
jgi:hypothetical protein